jgi:hypothetical protein
MDCKVIPDECVITHTNFWWLIFIFRYAFGEIEALK